MQSSNLINLCQKTLRFFWGYCTHCFQPQFIRFQRGAWSKTIMFLCSLLARWASISTVFCAPQLKLWFINPVTPLIRCIYTNPRVKYISSIHQLKLVRSGDVGHQCIMIYQGYGSISTILGDEHPEIAVWCEQIQGIDPSIYPSLVRQWWRPGGLCWRWAVRISLCRRGALVFRMGWAPWEPW